MDPNYLLPFKNVTSWRFWSYSWRSILFHRRENKWEANTNHRNLEELNKKIVSWIFFFKWNTEFKERAWGGGRGGGWSWQGSFILIWYNYFSSLLNTSGLPCSVTIEQVSHVRAVTNYSGVTRMFCLVLFLDKHCSSMLTNDNSVLSTFVYSHWFQYW